LDLPMPDLTRVLDEAGRGDEGATARLLAALYDELRRMARDHMRNERPGHTLQPTALVHEAWLRLVDEDGKARFENKAHFFGAAASALRRILVEHARRRSRKKRGGGAAREDSSLDRLLAPEEDARVLAVDDALAELSGVDRAKAELVELRYFAGLTVDEVARIRGTSPSTVARDWRVVRAWLQGRLGPSA
jgi:RNA polymerase sigma factor (TIGR02999 family)